MQRALRARALRGAPLAGPEASLACRSLPTGSAAASATALCRARCPWARPRSGPGRCLCSRQARAHPLWLSTVSFGFRHQLYIDGNIVSLLTIIYITFYFVKASCMAVLNICRLLPAGCQCSCGQSQSILWMFLCL